MIPEFSGGSSQLIIVPAAGEVILYRLYILTPPGHKIDNLEIPRTCIFLSPLHACFSEGRIAMAGSYLRHFADPHMLQRLQYSCTASHTCDICLSKLAGRVGYRCNTCNLDIHEYCADSYKPTITFFAHPWHTLQLSRIPRSGVGWVCDLCREKCPPGSLVYRCIDCLFDVHPRCTRRFPQTIRSSLHPEHDLRMVPSSGHVCGACGTGLPVWQYVCGGCKVRFHIACVKSG